MSVLQTNVGTCLTVSGLSLKTRHGNLQVPDLKLAAGKIYHVHSSDQLMVEELLYLLAGLAEPLTYTMPAPDGKLRRVPVPPNPEELAKVKLCGQRLFEMPVRQRARAIGFLFRNPEWAVLGATVLEEFMFSFAACGLPPPSDFQLKKYGILPQKNQGTMTLSGGEMHRLNCATVLEPERLLVVADFTRSNLDASFVKDLRRWFSELANGGATLVLTGLRPDELPPRIHHLSIESGILEIMPEKPKEMLTLEQEIALLMSSVPIRDPQGQPVLTATNLRGKYMSATVTCTVRRGELMLVTGPNGSGKTALARMLAERAPAFTGDYELHNGVYPVLSFQHPEHCFFASTVWQELPDESILKSCQIDEYQWATHPRNLAPWQQKLLNVAVALKSAKGLAILDEPTCGMTPQAKLRFLRLLEQFPELGILIITHDPVLIKVLGHVAHLNLGGR